MSLWSCCRSRSTLSLPISRGLVCIRRVMPGMTMMSMRVGSADDRRIWGLDPCFNTREPSYERDSHIPVSHESRLTGDQIFFEGLPNAFFRVRVNLFSDEIRGDLSRGDRQWERGWRPEAQEAKLITSRNLPDSAVSPSPRHRHLI